VKILVATDFSPAAETAARTAALLARKVGGSILLARAIEPPAVLYPEMSGADIEGLEGAIRRGVESQLAQATAVLRAEGFEVGQRLLYGFPEHAIPTCAREEKVDLLVLGAHGRRAVARLLLGSVAERVLVEAPCPVLVVRAAERPFGGWGDGARRLRVLVGVDMSTSTDAALTWLRDFRRVVPADVVLVHHYWPPREYARLGLPGPRDVFETDREVVAALDREVRRRIGELPGEGELTIRIEAAWGRPGEALADDARAERADLLLVGTHQPHGWQRLRAGSAAIAALRTTEVPLLCVPASLRPAVPPGRESVPRLRTVLAATDLSDVGNLAVRHACSLLRGAGGVIELCYVHERALARPIYAHAPFGEPLATAEREQLEARLRALVPDEAERLHIEVHVTVADGGGAAEAIVQAARRLGADAICLTSHARAGLPKAALGGVAGAVVASSDIPVYVVRAPRE
jgi:nucleotide-binding universal stress UspA family protein